MTTQEVDDEHPQSIIKNEDEAISEKPVQKMKPPLDTKVPKSLVTPTAGYRPPPKIATMIGSVQPASMLRYYCSKVLTKKIKSNNSLTCNICQKTFNSSQPLRFHIRQMYFNLKAKTLLHEMKKVKQVWVEKVLNSNDLIEITKTGPNTLLMKKTERNAIVEPNVEIKEIDLSYLYPTYNKYHYKECTICEVKVPRKRYKKHIVSHMI